MKSKFLWALTMLLAYQASAQEQGPTVTVDAIGSYLEWGERYQYMEPAGTYRKVNNSNETGIRIRDGLNAMLIQEQNIATNKIIGAGSVGIHRGFLDTPDAQFEIDSSVNGRIFANSGAGANTELLGYDDPNRSQIRGSQSSGQLNTSGPDNAITIFGDSGNWTFREGNYYGANRFSGAYFNLARTLSMTGTSFVAGSYQENSGDKQGFISSDVASFATSVASSGLYIGRAQALYIENKNKDTDRFQASEFSGITARKNRSPFESLLNGRWLVGGAGLTAKEVGGASEILGGRFIGSQQIGNSKRVIDYVQDNIFDANLNASGGAGAIFSGGTGGSVTIHDGWFLGGPAGDVFGSGPNAIVSAVGGSGLALLSKGTVAIKGGNYLAGSSGDAWISISKIWLVDGSAYNSDANGRANAYGGNGIFIQSSGTTTIGGNTIASGTPGGASKGSVNATSTGGSGLYASGTIVTITDGQFTGAQGGNAFSEGEAFAYGGAGARVNGGSLTVHGGTFRGGQGGFANNQLQMGNLGIFVNEGSLTIDQTNTTMNILGDILFSNTTTKQLGLKSGHVEGNLYKTGAGLTTMTVNPNASYSGAFIQQAGTVNVNLSSSEESKFFSNVTIGDVAAFNLNGTNAITAENALFTLGNANSSRLTTAMAMDLSNGARINARYGQVAIGGDLHLGENAAVSVGVDFLSGKTGRLDIAGALWATNMNSRIIAHAISTTPTGEITVVTSSAVMLGNNSITDVVDVDTGWLTQMSGVNTNSGIDFAYEYKSLTNNVALADLGTNLLTKLDAMITSDSSISNGVFFSINKHGERGGEKLIRYSESQVPDAADVGFQTQQQVAEQIAARGAEFRSMNGFASTKPRFGKKTAPAGAAGPAQETGDLQGWVRAYGSLAERDPQGSFAAYDLKTYGSVMGIDRSFGNILIGLAGGAGVANIEAEDAYQADVTTYHGSIYSTIGGDDVFIDLALTYGMADTESKNSLASDTFDSYIVSGYIGGGKSFNVKGFLKITPEASLLSSYYSQDDYNRAGFLQKTIEAYDEWSHVAAAGVTVASQHQIDWLKNGLALIPEFRAHWLHEFNPDLKDFSYTTAAGRQSFAVRSREEDLLRLGLGFDVWSWKYQNAKFEIDYDGLFSSEYAEHAVSGKFTLQF